MYGQRVQLKRADFDKQKEVFSHEGMRVLTSAYDTGVPYLVVMNKRGHFELLPYRGHQIWTAEFDNTRLGMESLIDEPSAFKASVNFARRSKQYLGEYGALLVPCGPRRMGCPDRAKDYPIHGTDPLMNFKDPCIIGGSDENGPYVKIVGVSDDPLTKGRGYDFTVKAATKIYLNQALIHAASTTINNRKKPMDFMFLWHANHRKIKDSEIVYAPDLLDLVVRGKDPGHIKNLLPVEQEAYHRLKTAFRADPIQHRFIDLSVPLYPEIVFYGRQEGTDRAIAAQVRRNKVADVTMYDPNELSQLVIWLRDATKKQADREGFVVTNSLGFLPATGKPQGVNDAIRDSEVGTVRKSRTVHCTVGLLNENELRDAIPDLEDRLEL